jgi:D-alanyl-D-alanine carboxypeptidase (penicillin-binding protein 5/6)
LNLLKTSYADPHGLSDQSLSSAFDQSILLSYALNYPKFKEIISTPQVTVTAEDGRTHDLVNSNRLITDDMRTDYVIGGKTGFTLEAGHSLACAASKDGHTLISVVLNTVESTNTASAKETKKLLEWGFSNYIWK